MIHGKSPDNNDITDKERYNDCVQKDSLKDPEETAYSSFLQLEKQCGDAIDEMLFEVLSSTRFNQLPRPSILEISRFTIQLSTILEINRSKRLSLLKQTFGIK